MIERTYRLEGQMAECQHDIKDLNYGKTHLLEKGHMAVDGSWVAPRQHIAPVEEKAGNWMMDMLTKRIGG